MKIRTLEMLSDQLAAELGWRKRELTDIRNLIQTAANKTRRRVLVRSGIALLYAHLEGFTKKAGSAYLEYVYFQNIAKSRIARNFLALNAADIVSRIQQSKKPSAYTILIDFFLDSQSSKATIPYKNAVDTESNLSSKVLKEIIFTLGFDYSFYEPKEKLIDSKLLARRNYIAHGEDIDTEEVDYDELHETVIELVNCLYNQIENGAASRVYERPA